MKMLESIQKALKTLNGSFINHRNEIILIPKFNVYTLLDDVESDDDFKVKLCEWFSRDCCCALRYSQQKRLERYWKENTESFNFICGTNFTVEQMNYIYTYLGNGIKHELAKKFVKSNFDISVIENYEVFDVCCENCGHYEEKPDNVSKTKFIKEMRQKGWRIGEPTFCPACAATVKGHRGVTPMERG